MKPFSQIIKENITLVVAIALPVFLAICFIAVRQLNYIAVAPPQHNFLVATKQWNYNSKQVHFQVVNGELETTFYYPHRKKDGDYDYNRIPTLYYVDAKSMLATPINLKLPDNWRNPSEELEGDSRTIQIPDISDKKWTAALISPDGYEFGKSDRYDYNIMTDVFSSSRSSRSFRIKNGGRFDKIRGIPSDEGSLDFIAWEIE